MTIGDALFMFAIAFLVGFMIGAVQININIGSK